MRINYFSDIHLEFGTCPPPSVEADIIIAAGDIGIYDQGIEWLKSFNKPVIYVAGNHEYYTHEYHQTLQMLREQCAGTNIHFLENNTLEYEGVRFIGCSLWTDLFIEGEETADSLAISVNDFRRIRFSDGMFTPKQFSQLHKKSTAWLEEELLKPFYGKTIVVTHHAPTLHCWYGSTKKYKVLAYCNNLKNMFRDHEIAAWFHGHTHSIGNHRLSGTRILSNTRGYIGHKIVEEFDINKVVDI